MSPAPVRILGIDTSLRCSGFGVVEQSGPGMHVVEYGCFRTRPDWLHTACLLTIHEGIQRVIQQTQPAAAAIEGAFFCKNVKTAMVLGEARGVAIAACAISGIPVYEYAPRRVKQAVTGVGGAEKQQVMKMVMRLLGLDTEIQQDAADALALAICHLQSARGISKPSPL